MHIKTFEQFFKMSAFFVTFCNLLPLPHLASLYIHFRSGALFSGLDFFHCTFVFARGRLSPAWIFWHAFVGINFFFPGRLSAARDRTWFGFADILLKICFFHAAKCPFSSLLSGSVWPCTYLTKSDRAGLCANGTLERASFLLLFVAVLLLRCALHVG